MSKINKLSKLEKINNNTDMDPHKNLKNKKNIEKTKNISGLDGELNIDNKLEEKINPDRINISKLSKDISELIVILDQELESIELNKEKTLDMLKINRDLIEDIESFIVNLDLEREDILSQLETILSKENTLVEGNESLDLQLNEIIDEVNLIKEKLEELELDFKNMLVEYNNKNKELLKEAANKDSKLLREILVSDEEVNLIDEYNLGRLDLENIDLVIESKLILLDTIRLEIKYLEEVMENLPNLKDKVLEEDMGEIELKTLVRKQLFFLRDRGESIIRELNRININLRDLLNTSLREEQKLKSNDIFKILNKKENKDYDFFYESFNLEELKELRDKEVKLRREMESYKTNLEKNKNNRRDLHPGYLNILNNLDGKKREIFIISLIFFFSLIIIKIIF